MDVFSDGFDDAIRSLKQEVKQLAQDKLKAGTIARDEMCTFVYENNPDAAKVYQRM